jgi:L-iditol 2-dehydrogenase
MRRRNASVSPEKVMMKAAVLEGIGRIIVKEVEEPVCPDDSVMIRVRACAICGSDLRLFRRADRRLTFPQIIGHEIAGEIAEVGAAVKDFTVGQRVTAAPGPTCGECIYCKKGLETQCLNMIHVGYDWPGGFAEFHVPPAASLRGNFINRIPDSVSFEEASLAEPLACCINGQELSNVGRGDSVAIIGAGPAGCMHVELARLRGAQKVFLIQRSQKRLEMARKKVRADAFISSEREDFVKRILEETSGYGVDVVIVACPSKEAQEKSLHIIKGGGRINFFGGLSADDSMIRIDGNIIHYKECFVHGSQSSTGAQNRQALELLSRGKIRAQDFITHTFALSEAEQAMKTAESHEGLKVLVRP